MQPFSAITSKSIQIKWGGQGGVSIFILLSSMCMCVKLTFCKYIRGKRLKQVY